MLLSCIKGRLHQVLKNKQKEAVCDAAGCTDLRFQQQGCCRVVVELPGLHLPGTAGLAPPHSPAEAKSRYTEIRNINGKYKIALCKY